MSRFGLNIEKVIKELSPLSRRKDFDVAWLKALLSRITKLHGKFTDKVAVWDDDSKYAPGHTMQVEKLLVDRFLPGITIQNNKQEALPFYAYADDNALNLYTKGDDNEPVVFDSGDDSHDPSYTSFTILIPATSILAAEDQEPFFAYGDDSANNLFTKGDDSDILLFDFGDDNYLVGYAELVYNPERITATVNRFKAFNKTFNIEIV